jgi:sugar/nucleoside kinase (ribokinase family)
LGGSAVYFACAASFFTPVRLVGAVGEDAPQALLQTLKGRDIDASGLEVRAGSKTFRWHGSYLKDINQAQTVTVDLNVLAERAPKIPAAFLDSRQVFLANTHPALQQQMVTSLKAAQLIVADTMNLWIENERKALLKLLGMVHGLVLNDGEARMLTGTGNLVQAAREVLRMGPQFVVIKKGEHGCLMCRGDETFVLPAFPAERVVDPTGAGDSFAGGMMGYLATRPDLSSASIRRALAFGTVVASFTIADFSLDGLLSATRDAIDKRVAELELVMRF